MTAATKISCYLCSSFADAFTDVVRHIGNVHSHDPDFQVTCELDGCRRQYSKFGSYKVHLYHHHNHKMKFEKTPSPVPEETVSDNERPGRHYILTDHTLTAFCQG